MTGTPATKSNLIAAKRARALAGSACQLMERKQGILSRELAVRQERALALRRELAAALAPAAAALAAAACQPAPWDTAQVVAVDNSLQVQYRSLMGVELPCLPGEAPPPWPEYGLLHTSAALDECYVRFHRIKALIRRLAEEEAAASRLAAAARKTQKRTNALGHIVLPRLDGAIRALTGALEEKEREEFARLKAAKGRRDPLI